MKTVSDPMCEADSRSDWMQTYTGRVFWPLDPRPEDVDIIDVAHALANICRYNGHCTLFFSVAQHSVLVSRIVPREDALWGLLHDAAEAYVADLIRPIKHIEGAAWYREAEARVMAAVCGRFGLPAEQPASVDAADLVMLATERRDLMVPSPRPWRRDGQPLAERIEPWTPQRAELEFLQRAADLGVRGVRWPRLELRQGSDGGES